MTEQIQSNQITLLKKCLEFYANPANYGKTLSDGSSMIDKDSGFLAGETLKSVILLDDQNNQIIEDYNKLIGDGSSTEQVMDEVKKIIDQVNNL